MRIWIFGIVMLLLACGWIWLDRLMATIGWATRNHAGSWDLTHSGWSVLWAAWPLALFGALFGGSLAWFALAYAWRYVTDVDHRHDMATLTEACEQREQQAEKEVQQAKKREAHALSIAKTQAEQALAHLGEEALRQTKLAQHQHRQAQAEQARYQQLNNELASQIALNQEIYQQSQQKLATAGAVLQRANKKLRQRTPHQN